MPEKKSTNGDNQAKQALLKRIPLFGELKADELELVALYSEFVRFADGQTVFSHGTNGETLFAVRTGAIRIVSDKEGDGQDIARFIEDELFGELDLFEDAPRSVDALAEGETELLVFPGQGRSFESLLEKHPLLFARILHKLLAQISKRIRETNRLVSEKTPWIDDLKKQLLFDKLTGLYNKTFLEEELGNELSRWGNTAALLAVKPDNFKLINDGYGHEAGDKTLRTLADAVKAGVGGEGIVVRYRGDEFIAVLPRTDARAGREVAERLLTLIPAIDLFPVIRTREIALTASIGLAVSPDHGGEAALVVGKAVEKMFEARTAGGNRII